MTTRSTNSPVSRRTALAGLGTGGLGLALTVPGRNVAAQDEVSSLTGHPLLGTWAVMISGAVVPQIHGPDGSLVVAFPPNYVDPVLGLVFQGPALGRWESTGTRSGRLMYFQPLSDDAGAYIGTFLSEGSIEASEDGQSWVATGTVRTVVYDAGNAVIFDQTTPAELPVTTPTAATPTA